MIRLDKVWKFATYFKINYANRNGYNYEEKFQCKNQVIIDLSDDLTEVRILLNIMFLHHGKISVRTKGLQDRNIHILDGTTVKKKVN